MKSFHSKICKITLLLAFFIILIPNGYSQVKKVGVILYPKNYKVMNNQNRLNLKKTSYDTLSYTTFKKTISDFDIIKGCGSFGADQTNVNIARSNDGGYMCVWEDHSSGYIEIVGQLFNANDEKIGSVLNISDQFAHWNSEPHIAYNPVSGEYIITWASSGYDILIQRVSKSGNKIGSNEIVTQAAGTNTNNPSAAVNNSGDILVTWYSDAGNIGNIKVYCRLFDKDLNPKTDQQIISQPPFDQISSVGWDDRVAADTSGNFIVTWSSHYNNASPAVMQVISNKGEAVNGNIMISDSTDPSSNIFPAITATKDGYFFIIWTSGAYVSGRIYKLGSGFVTPQLTISDIPSSWYTYTVSSDYKKYFYIAFQGSDEYTQIIDKNGNFIGKNKNQPVLRQTFFADYLRLSNAISGSIYCVYYGYVKNVQEVMIQKFDTSFTPASTPLKLGNDNCGASQTNPVVKFNNSGKSIITWIDRRDGTDNLYAQVFDENTNPIGNNFLVNDTSSINWTSNPFILSGNDGNFIIFFSGGMYSNQNLIYQKISAGGEKIGSNVKLTNYYYSNVKCTAQTDSLGNILLCWYISSNSYSPIYFEKFNGDMTPLNGVNSIFSAYSLPQRRYFGISINKKLDVLAAWANYDSMYQSPAGELKAMIFNEEGTAVSDTIHVFNLSNQRLYADGTCRLDNSNNTVFEWSDFSKYYYDNNINILRRYKTQYRTYIDTNTINNINVFTNLHIINFNNKKVFASWSDYENINSLYLDDNNQTYVPVRLQTIQPFVYTWGQPYDDYGVDIYNDKLMFAYETIIDTGRGLDIWANVQNIDKFNFNTDPYSIFNVDAVEKVSDAYPDPVKTRVSFKFQLERQATVNISVYNILGQKVGEIRNGVTMPGVYNETFNTKGLPSGIYFIYYRGIKSFTKKFLVVK